MGDTNVTLAPQPPVLAQQTPTSSPYRKQPCCNGDTYTRCYLANKEWCVNSCKDKNCDRDTAEKAAIVAEKADADRGVFWTNPPRV